MSHGSADTHCIPPQRGGKRRRKQSAPTVQVAPALSIETLGSRRLPIDEGEAGAYITMSVAWMRAQRRNGGGPPYIQIGRAIRYLPDDLDAWLTTQRVEPKR